MGGKTQGSNGSGNIDDLVNRLAEAEAAIEASEAGCVDAIIDIKTATPILLRQAQKALVASVSRLEQMVQERTAELQMMNAALRKEIAERKTAEESLRQSEQQYRLLFETMEQGVIYQDADGKVFSMNLAAERILGKTKKELLDGSTSGHDYFAIHEDGSSFPIEEHPAAVSSRTKLPVRDVVMGVFNPRENDYRWINVNAVPLLKKDRTSLVYTLFEDITERKRAEEALRESEEKYRHIVEYAPTGIYEMDYTGPRLKCVNDAMCEVLGYTREELLAANPFDLMDKESQRRFQERIQKILAGEHVDESVAFRVFCKDGREIWAALNVKLMYADGKLDGALVVAHDITERKRIEEALRKAKDELELRVQERTAELSNAKENLEVINQKLQMEISKHEMTERELKAAKEDAEAAVKAKAAFLANMSHEIRTPMNIVIGVTDLLLGDPLTPEQRENVELLRINSEALLSIINDILDFSKIESDKLVLEKQPFKLLQLVEESLDLVSLKASEKNLNIAYIIDKSVPDTIIGDPGRLRQVLGNLLSNAVKFTDKGEITLFISCKRIGGTYGIHFAVQDTGIGIPKDRMSLLFQPFSQMEPSTSRLYGGTGLGLAISKDLVDLMGGKIWAESEVGKGSTFHVIIKASSTKSESEQMAISPMMIGKHVLIVSESKTNRRILGRQIYDWGMIPTASRSVEEALGWLKRGGEFDVAILDADMQDMSSLDLEEEIRKYNKTLPLVFLTPFGKRIPPGHAYLTKPIKISQMHKVLAEILPRQPAQIVNQSAASSRPDQDGPLRILLAEDNISSQKITLGMLKKLGYKADIAANGIEALQAMERKHYDIVLMDIKMPEMDGLEAARIARQRWKDNCPKIIAITAYAIEGDREKFMEAGMDDYIAKPVRIEDLENALMNIGNP
ncbi:MAG: PAS domain S-box protein [Methanotrichaceae archaeon]